MANFIPDEVENRYVFEVFAGLVDEPATVIESTAVLDLTGLKSM
jgi:hypothetical protein